MHDSRKRLFAGAVVLVAGLAIALAFRKPTSAPVAPPLTSSGFTEVVPAAPIAGPQIAVEPTRPKLDGRIEIAPDSAPQVPSAYTWEGFGGSAAAPNAAASVAPFSTSGGAEKTPPIMATSLDAARAGDVKAGPVGVDLNALPKVDSGTPGDPSLKPLTQFAATANAERGGLSPQTGLPPLRDATAGADSGANAIARGDSVGTSRNPFDRFPNATASSVGTFGIPDPTTDDAATSRSGDLAWRPKQAALPNPPRTDAPAALQLLRDPAAVQAPYAASYPPAVPGNPVSPSPYVASNVDRGGTQIGRDFARPIPIDGRRHRVADGDTLESIARAYYGDPARANEIFAANRGLLRSADLLPIGAELAIPDVGAASAGKSYEAGRPTPAAADRDGSSLTVPQMMAAPFAFGTANTPPVPAGPAAPQGWPAANSNASGVSETSNPFAAAAAGPTTGWPPKGIENTTAPTGNAWTRSVSATGETLGRFGNSLLGAATPGTQSAGRTYLVRPLESWESLAQRYYGDASKANMLRAANPQLAAGALKPGMVVAVPAK
ncbi:MAG: tail protein X [Pirellulales bacterium]